MLARSMLARSMTIRSMTSWLDIARVTINSIENERYTPSLPLALALARFFGVKVEEMFDDQGS
jgi:putative transcriptional regulator